jgi:caa(3)-type oxidase, subunit IV
MTEHTHDPAPQHHTTGLVVYFAVFAGLIACTILTVAVSRLELGWLNTPIAMAIAITKSVLVVLFFMHLIHSTRLTKVVIIGALLWVGVLFALTFADYATRLWQIY